MQAIVNGKKIETIIEPFVYNEYWNEIGCNNREVTPADLVRIANQLASKLNDMGVKFEIKANG